MIIAVTSLKGGVGKSTLTFNLACLLAHMGVEVAIADADVNQHCLYWADRRQLLLDAGEALPRIDVYSAQEIPTAPGSRDTNLKTQLGNIRGRYDHILIDGTPSLGKQASRILYHADFALIPIEASGPDTVALDLFTEKLHYVNDDRGSELHAAVVLNRYDGQLNVNRLMRQALVAAELPVLEHTIGSRTIYKEAFLEGRGIMEVRDEKGRVKNQKAIDEFTMMFNELSQRLRVAAAV